jgi:hypothetical protein
VSSDKCIADAVADATRAARATPMAVAAFPPPPLALLLPPAPFPLLLLLLLLLTPLPWPSRMEEVGADPLVAAGCRWWWWWEEEEDDDAVEEDEPEPEAEPVPLSPFPLLPPLPPLPLPLPPLADDGCAEVVVQEELLGSDALPPVSAEGCVAIDAAPAGFSAPPSAAVDAAACPFPSPMLMADTFPDEEALEVCCCCEEVEFEVRDMSRSVSWMAEEMRAWCAGGVRRKMFSPTSMSACWRSFCDRHEAKVMRPSSFTTMTMSGRTAV